MSVLLGNGAGSFGAATNFAAGAQPNSVAVGDFNGDGKADLATANRAGHSVSVLLGNGAGSFGIAADFAAGSYPRTVTVGDINGDGRPDLAVSTFGNGVSVLLGDGAGSFGTAMYFAAGGNPNSATVGDFNLDGQADIAVANNFSNNVSVLLGGGGIDYSDAPTGYPVTLAENGARHTATGPTLGATRDSEADGTHSAGADFDDLNGTTPDDEDGITAAGPLVVGQTTNITINVQGGPGFVNAWADLNRDGDWADLGEQFLTNLAVVAGNNVIPFSIPSNFTPGTIVNRYRLTSASVASPSPTGLLPDGEVEDYVGTIFATPTITTNAISISEGQTLVLGSAQINTTDPDTTPAQLTYTASGVTNGRFELVSVPGVAITSFTQAQINSSAVRFVHNGGELSPSYSLTVNDGALTSAASTGAVTFTNVNDAPVILTNTLTIAEGATVVLGSGNMNTTDPDNTPAQLTYTPLGVAGGRFELVATPGVAITSFTQAQINAGAVQFVHNGGETAASYFLTVSDGAASSSSSGYFTFSPVNDAPVISTNTLTIAEGATVVLGSGNINTIDPDNPPAQLNFTASGVTNGRFELVSAPGVAITSFTQAQINSGAVRFVHNGGELAPSFSLTVRDFTLSSPTSASAVTFTNVNDNAPVFISNSSRSIAENGTLVGNVTATDADLPIQTVTYAITGGADATKFTITSAGVLSFVSAPDFESPTDVGGNNTYDLQVTASDGNGLSTVQNVSVTILDVVETLTPGVTLQNGVLRIIGTNGADVVGITEYSGTLSVAMFPPQSVQSFRSSDVIRIEIILQGGSDRANIGPLNNRQVLIDGGDDNDYLNVAFGETTIFGGNGNDFITGGSARNWIDAGSGDDTVYGGDADDILFGGEGNDLLYGAGGKDVIDGGAHNDSIYGGRGDDLIRGGSGNDRLYGEDGNDVLLGNEGVDYLYGGYGRDLLIGGTGADVLSGEFDDDLLIGGATTFDNSDAVLLALLAEWSSARTYDQRIANLRGTGSGTRLNGSSFLTTSTVTDDSAVDLFYGNQGRDWFWAVTGQDQINDKSSDENIN